MEIVCYRKDNKEKNKCNKIERIAIAYIQSYRAEAGCHQGFKLISSCLSLKHKISTSAHLIQGKVRQSTKWKPKYKKEYEISKKLIDTGKYVNMVVA